MVSGVCSSVRLVKLGKVGEQKAHFALLAPEHELARIAQHVLDHGRGHVALKRLAHETLFGTVLVPRVGAAEARGEEESGGRTEQRQLHAALREPHEPEHGVADNAHGAEHRFERQAQRRERQSAADRGGG